MDIDQIFRNNQQWINQKLKDNPDFFDQLSKGQSPEILYIGCSDSRVPAEEIMGAKPGQLFVHRNIANLACNTDLSAMGVINFAVEHLKVKHIIICGHYGCGGIKAAMEAADYAILNPWLRNIRDVYRLHRNELNPLNNTEKYNRLVEFNVLEQCTNVIKTPEVQRALKQKRITVHGWVFDLKSGHLKDLKINTKDILKQITEIYNLE